MKTLGGVNVNNLFLHGVALFQSEQKHLVRKIISRAGSVMEYVQPVASTYRTPCERVLFDSVRNANPFFHFFESLWILAGRADVPWLRFFLSKIEEFSDNGHTFHGAYGWRLRRTDHDQLRWVCNHLHKEPNSRRAVLSIFNHLLDHRESKDIPCNATLAFTLRDGELNLTVFCRSNDMVWGAYGANVVQFSFILELVARVLNVRVGSYTQISNNFHVYELEPTWQRMLRHRYCDDSAHRPSFDLYRGKCFIDGIYMEQVEPFPLIPELGALWPNQPYEIYDAFTSEVDMFCNAAWDCITRGEMLSVAYQFPFFRHVAVPMFNSFQLYKGGRIEDALENAHHYCLASDWQTACVLWLNRIITKRQGGNHGGE